jgi:hypothetical protein
VAFAAPRRQRVATGDVEILDPPTDFDRLDPAWVTLPRGTRLFRIYAPQKFAGAPVRFRTRGPYVRFDHQRPDADGKPRVDRQRGILYAGVDFLGCVGEYFGDTGEIVRVGNRLARLSVLSALTLLDLRGTEARAAGTIPAIGSISQRRTTQAWARWWYEHPDLTAAHGLIYTSAQSGRDVMAIWERARGRIACRRSNHWGLDDPRLNDDLNLAAARLRLPLA